jgi:hypothetical protein
VAAAHACAEEFVAHHGLAAARHRVLIDGEGGDAGAALAARIGVPLVSPASALEMLLSGDAAALEREGDKERSAALLALRTGLKRVVDAYTAAQVQAAEAHAARMAAAAAAAAEPPAAKGKGGKGSAAPPPEQQPSAPISPLKPPKPLRLPVTLEAKSVRAVLTAPTCARLGWVLEGWSATSNDAAHALFGLGLDLTPTEDELLPGAGEGGEERGGSKEGGVPALDGDVAPTLVLSLLGEGAARTSAYGNAAAVSVATPATADVVISAVLGELLQRGRRLLLPADILRASAAAAEGAAAAPVPAPGASKERSEGPAPGRAAAASVAASLRAVELAGMADVEAVLLEQRTAVLREGLATSGVLGALAAGLTSVALADAHGVFGEEEGAPAPVTLLAAHLHNAARAAASAH